MKKTLTEYLVLIAIIASIALELSTLTGCVTANPDRTPIVQADGSTNFPPAFVTNDGAISNVISKVQTALKASEPINPYATPLEAAVGMAALLFTFGSGVYAKVKSSEAAKSKATAQTATATAQTLATGVVAANAQAKVLEVASSTPVFAAVANHLNEATP